jgi:hypothetical protein
MNKTIPAIITLSALALALGACTPEQRMSHRAAPGSYNSTETSTDDKGTTTVKDSTTVVTVDEDGNRKETVTSKTSRDPKGLMNKTTKKTKHTTEEKY